MWVRCRREREALRVARGVAVGELARFGFMAGLVAVTAYMAVTGLAGVAPAVVWVLLGVVAGGVADAGCSAVAAGWEAATLACCRRCLRDAADQTTVDGQVEAYEDRRADCARARHRLVTR